MGMSCVKPAAHIITQHHLSSCSQRSWTRTCSEDNPLKVQRITVNNCKGVIGNIRQHLYKMVLCDTVAWRRWLYFEFFIVNIMDALSQRLCTNAPGFIEDRSYYLGNDTKAYPVEYGDCSFGESLCNYTQLCTDIDAENWRQIGDYAECPGKNGLLDSFSVLVSPLLEISQVICLTFEYTQEAPGKLSVYLATSTTLILLLPEELSEKRSFVNFTAELPNIVGKVVFRARSADTNHKVQLRGVKLQNGSCTEPGSTQTMPGTISSVLELETSKPEATTTFLSSTWPRSEDHTTDYPAATISQSNNDQKTPVIVGAVVAVVIVIACIVALVIIVIRKRRKKQQGGKGTGDDTQVAGIVNDLHNDSEDPLSGTTLVDIKDTRVFSKPDVDPCDIADDGLPGSTRSAVIDNCGHTPSHEDKARSCSSSQESHKQSKEPSEIYSQVHKKKETVDVYSQIHKKNKETLNKSLEQSSPLHSHKIFELSEPQRPLAMANTEDEQDYNALNFEQHRQVGKNSPPREDSRQTYDHIQGDVGNDCPKVEDNRQDANMVVDTEYDHLGT